MPPKAARGAARGRGRGRGRGGTAPVAHVSSAPAPESESESQLTVADTPMVDAEPAMNTTPVHDQNDEQNDPNSSPATQPTETPAPTPVRLPPTASNGNGVSASGSGVRGSGTAKPSKFKPKIVRANAKEREEREVREREKEQARLSAASTAAGRAKTWVRGRGGRGRGDAMGRGRGSTNATPSGPFAVAPSSDKKGFFAGGSALKREPGGHYSRSGGSGTLGSGVKKESGTFSNGGNHDLVAGRYIPEPQYPHEDDDAPRVDIELINIQSDSEEDVVVTGVRNLNDKGTMSNKGGLKPIRLDRKEHKERVTMVNTEPTIKSAPEDDNDPDVMIVDEAHSSKVVPTRREWKGTYVDEVRVKREPGTIPEISYAPQPTTSSPPPAEFKAPTEIGDGDSEPEPQPTKPEPVSPRTARKAQSRSSSKRKEKKPVIQTEEDRAEWERRLEDMDVLRKELLGLTMGLRLGHGSNDMEGDTDMEGGAVQDVPEEKLEDGRCYLFQFPPVIPKLYDDKTSANPNNTGFGDDDDVEMISHDLTKDDKVEIKSEEKVIEIKQEELDADELLRQQERDKLVVEEGAIGKLILKESGAVELVWGGTRLKVGRGVETNFFCTGAIVDGMDSWGKDEKGTDVPVMYGGKGRSMAMGDIMGKFVVTPDWSNVR